MVNWKPPNNVSEVRSFLGLAGYYRKFAEGFSKIATPLTKMIRKVSSMIRWKSVGRVSRSLRVD